MELLSPAARATLEALPLQDAGRAERVLQALANRAGPPHVAVPVVEEVIEALPDSADAEMALVNLERWSAQLPTPLTTLSLLREDPRLLADLLAVLGASQYLADILARDPWLYSLFMEDTAPRSREQYRDALAASLGALHRPEARRDALRRVKRREFLRIGWRDLARRAPLEEIVAEISDLADVVVETALQIARDELDPSYPTARQEVAFAVIAMGKLGARELNYSSDIDLMFVMESPSPQDERHRRYAAGVAQRMINILAEDTSEGRCFRVDTRLRPEGRTGSLVRSYPAFRAYYDRWVETWERQALIKARAVAGDAALGKRFEELIRPVVYRRIQGASLLEDVREMRAAVERKLDSAREMDQHVKEGRGTIRDVEFTVQLLQLLFGADLPALQVRDTAAALNALSQAGLFTPDERQVFVEGYRFFREVEHRLQLLNDLPVRLVPTDPADLRRLARTVGCPDAAAFQNAYRRHSERVRELAEAVHQRLGVETASVGDPLRTALLSADTAAGAAVLGHVLEERGFVEPARSLEALVHLAAGDPHYRHPSGTRRLFADIAPALLQACTEAADPDSALQGVAALAERKLLHRALFQMFQGDPESLRALCRFAGAAPRAMQAVLRYPELSDPVTDQEQLLLVRSRSEYADALAARLEAAPDYERRLSVLRRFKLRELVRSAARHAVNPVAPEVETREWSDLADALLSAALDLSVTHLRSQGRWPHYDAAGFAVLALGRHGGQDLHYTSDLDLVYIFDDPAKDARQAYELLAKILGEVLRTVTEEGPLFDLDLRLRPEGRQGFSVASLAGARTYYGEGGRAQTWEFQMLTRLRPVAGSTSTADAFMRLVEARVYRSPMPAEWRADIAAMKRRIERERVPEAHRPWHLKLGPGGFSDVEFIVQYLQLAHGGNDPSLRQSSTLDAIRALDAAGRLTTEQAQLLTDDHRLLTCLRQSLALLRPDESPDVLPVAPGEERWARALARSAGFPDGFELKGPYLTRTAPVRRMLREVLGRKGDTLI